MKTNHKHKKIAIFLLFLSAFIFLRSGMVAAFLTRFFADQRAIDYKAMHPGAPFPQDLQTQLAFFQSWWYMLGLGFLLALPVVYRIAKRLLFIESFKSSFIALIFFVILEIVIHFK